MLNLFEASLVDTSNSEEWVLGIGGELCRQITLYTNPQQRGFLYQCLGHVMKIYVQNDTKINEYLDTLFISTNQNEKLEYMVSFEISPFQKHVFFIYLLLNLKIKISVEYL